MFLTVTKRSLRSAIWLVVLVLPSSMSAHAQHASPASRPGVKHVDWKSVLAAAQEKLKSNPNSAFLHNQSAVAYDVLGDFSGFEREINTAIKLEPGNSNNFYVAYAVYKRRHLNDKAAFALDEAIKADPENPFGHYERATRYEHEKEWSKAVSEYRITKYLLEKLKSNPADFRNGSWVYLDKHNNPFGVSWQVDHIGEDLRRAQSEATANR